MEHPDDERRSDAQGTTGHVVPLTVDPAHTQGTQATPAPERHISGRAMASSLLLTAVFDVGVAILVFDLAKSRGLSDQVAYLLSGVGPLIMIAITWVRARALSGASLIILVFLVLSSAAAFIGGADSRLLIVKDSVVTGGFGLACLLSLLLPKPMMFYFGAKFATDGSREGISAWYGLWQYPQFRRVQYRINNVWGVAYLVEAALRIVLAYTIASFSVAYTITSILPFVFLAALIFWTVTTGRRAQAAAAQRMAAQHQSSDPVLT
jgi:hypothetical protein